jgi:hypothetical protein
VREADLVVSLLPFTLHVGIAQVAIDAKRPMVTTSYVSPEMRALDVRARDAGVLVLNEIGLDPGLDHMSAMRVIDGVRRDGGRLTSFRSCCGGIPAPDADTNPWHYKFSWSPRGVLLAGRSGARWLDDGRIVEVDAAHLYAQAAPYTAPGLPPLEVVPNRDSLAYVPTYGIEGVQTMFRGTLRWPGWAETLEAVGRLGLLDATPRPWRSGTTLTQLAEGARGPGHGTVTRAPRRPRGYRRGRYGDGPFGLGRAPVRSPDRQDGSVSARHPRGGARVEDGIRAARARSRRPASRVRLRRSSWAPATRGVHARRLRRAGGRLRDGADRVAAGGRAVRLILDGTIKATGVASPWTPRSTSPVLDALKPLGIHFS